MKKLSLFFIAATLGALLMNSCSIERRYHRTGFNVNWKNASVKIKSDKHQQTASDELTSEEVATIDKKSNKTSENATLNYTNAYENSVASSSNDIASNLTNTTSEVLIEQNPTFNKERVELSENTKPETNFKRSINARKGSQNLVFKAKNKILKSGAASPEPWVYILLILLVPFGTTISMFLYEGSWTKRVTVNLILTLLCGLPGLIHALVVIFGNK